VAVEPPVTPRKDTRTGRSPARAAAQKRINARVRCIPPSIFPAVDRAIDLVRADPSRAPEVSAALEDVFARDGGGPQTE
jgi:hypothetical protein